LHVASRYLTHALVLVAAILVPAFAVGGMKNHGVGPVIGSLAAARTASPTHGFLLKPEAVNASPQRRDISTYTVQPGDTVSGIAAVYGVSIDTVRWANNMSDPDSLSLGQKLKVPPVNGVLVKVQPGDTMDSLSTKYQAPSGSIIDFNLVRDPNHLVAGSELMIPQGQGEPLPTAGDSSSSGDDPGAGPPRAGSGSSAHFPWGQCTWYVATLRYVPWNGDAHSWFDAAVSYGFPVGHSPRRGSIMVTWEGWWGHVAYVQSVSGGCWTVTEMNYRGLGIVDERSICPGQVPLIGFVY
jgi:surface antigen